jgi:hypothetical protein
MTVTHNADQGDVNAGTCQAILAQIHGGTMSFVPCGGVPFSMACCNACCGVQALCESPIANHKKKLSICHCCS